MQETQVQSLGWEDPLEKEMSTHSCVLAWEMPWTEEPGEYSPWGRKRVRYNLATKQLRTQPKTLGFQIPFQVWARYSEKSEFQPGTRGP